MFRRRDVSALLEAGNHQEAFEANSMNADAATASPSPFPPAPSAFDAAAPMSYQPSAEKAQAESKKSLADHFVEQARPTKHAAALPPRTPQAAAPFTPMQHAPAPQSATLGALLDAGDMEGQRRILRVGGETILKGEISHCDRVVIEGQVEAQMKEVEALRITDTGSFIGNAKVGSAEISGRFEGELVVTGLLVIDETGSVKGKIAYGAIEIKRGGSMAGEIRIAGIEDGETKGLPFDLPAKSALRKKTTLATAAA